MRRGCHGAWEPTDPADAADMQRRLELLCRVMLGKTHRRSKALKLSTPDLHGSWPRDPMDLFSGAEERQKVLLIMGLRFWICFG